jgi:HSP20 family protein
MKDERNDMNLSLWNRHPLLEEFVRTRDELDRNLGRFFGTSMTPFGNMGPFAGFGLPASTTRSEAFPILSRLESLAPPTRLEGFAPPVDIGETDDEVTVRVEVPGVSPRDLDVTIEGTNLSIAGKKDEKEEFEGENSYRCERRFGAFRRMVELPESIDPDRVNADFADGVITIRLSKKPGLRARRVEVKPTARRVTVPG